MPHACGLALLRRTGLLLVAASFALLAVTPALQLAQLPGQLETERQLREVFASDAESKGGHWRAGQFERDMDQAGGRAAGVGEFAMLVGLAFLGIGAWRSRDEPEARRVWRALLVLVSLVVASGVAGALARRTLAGPVPAVDVVQVGAVFVAFAWLAAACGGRFAWLLGLAAVAAQMLKQVLVASHAAWLFDASPLVFRGAVPALLFLAYASAAAAFAAAWAAPGAAPPQRAGADATVA